MKTIFLLLISLTAMAANEGSFDGVYQGSMKLTGESWETPLQAALALTNEYVSVPVGGGAFEEQRVIEGSVLLDDEGGPYGFWRVTYSLDRSEVDMRYFRPNQVVTTEVPPSFRLIGNVDQTGTINGRVISGLRGTIGSFTLAHTTLDVMKVTHKFTGTWKGNGTTPTGKVFPFSVTVQTSDTGTVNPADYEFEFTPGKVGHYVWDSVQMLVTRVLFDYLKRRMVLIEDGPQGPAMSVECNFGADFSHIDGAVFSLYRGKSASFSLDRIASPADERSWINEFSVMKNPFNGLSVFNIH